MPSVFRAVVAAALVGLVTPAAAGGQAVPSVPNVRTHDGDAMLRITGRILLDTLATWDELPQSNAQVYTRMKQILDSLKIPYTRADSAGGLITHEGFVARNRRLAGRANSASLRCGFGPSGDYADVWRVNIIYAVFIHPVTAGRGTRLGLAFMGQAKDMSGATSSLLYCSSNGSLEQGIMGLLREEGSRLQQ